MSLYEICLILTIMSYFLCFLVCFITKSIVLAEYLLGKYLDVCIILLDARYLELLSESLGNHRASLSVGSPKEQPDQEFCQVGT